MKSEHRAKADFLRELAKYAKDLFKLGDFTCEDEKRVNLSSKIEGFVAAGSIIELVTRAEMQKVIDKAHFAEFGEEREARRTRILEERATQKTERDLDEEVDWDVYDSPAKDRKR
jgi:Zn-finger domain-containing protein